MSGIISKKSVTLTLPFPPSLNQAYPSNKQGRRFLSAKGSAFKKEVIRILNTKKISILKGKLVVELKLYRPRKIGDIDNFSKLIFDALKGVVIVDDSQVIELHIYRFDDKLSPRAEISLKEVN